MTATTAVTEATEITEQAQRLRLAITRTARRLRQSAGSELGPSTLAALATVERLGPLTPSALAEIEGIKRPTAARVISRLQDEGLAERSTDPSDGRCALISATAEGRATLERLRGRKTAYLARGLGELGERDLATLRRASEILERMLERERA
ncbi:MAG TPA: MarR family transcriptional regulator [Solirubrobacterales bacterium]|nr:MarR family transcriptional regulator [Solirubrobacterales bacterium]